MSVFEEIAGMFARRGDNAYHGEAVSQTEHALQAAHEAEKAGADHAFVVAALLHDVGHLLDEPEDLAERGVDGHHEDVGAAWLETVFGPEVSEPVRLHVAAKRYLCAVDPAYHAGLSPASVLSLSLQGGPFSGAEKARFEQNPHFKAAVRLRYCDDTAKVPGLEVPGLAHYREKIEAIAVRAEERRG